MVSTQIIIKIQAATTGHYPGKKRALLIVLGQEKKFIRNRVPAEFFLKGRLYVFTATDLVHNRMATDRRVADTARKKYHQVSQSFLAFIW